MQQSKGNIGHSKHRKAFGKPHRNQKYKIRTCAEVNKGLDEANEMDSRKRGFQEWTNELLELFK